MRYLFLLLFLPTFFLASAQNFKADSFSSQQVSEMNTWQLLKYDGLNTFNGVAYAYSRPFHWKKRDFFRAGATAALVGGLYIVDDETADYFGRQEDNVPELIRDFGWYFGSPQNNYGVTTGIYAYGLIAKDPEWRRTGVLMISSATAGGVLQQLLKAITGRARPQTGVGKDVFRPFSGESGYRSFPSGHTILSFTTAYALAKHFDNPWVKGGIYAVGLISPVSRLWSGAHFLTDVVLSLAIVVATVEGVDRYLDTRNGYGEKRYGDRKRKDRNPTTQIHFSAGINQIGLSLSF
ncbi:phosphatase PAP2 family protein [Nonlabens xiamenensis]|uniref:phosphatase PAP2 family protein n=1 Tax=Nonlabens xiamenensis TaxID=2341043 RepID=UPI001F0CB822|nr:phosphatase PAP2 family protein [Nonlabens xiamenensis]